MAWGEQAAEQWEKDQPSTPVLPGALGRVSRFQAMLDALPPVETPAEVVLDADERRGD